MVVLTKSDNDYASLRDRANIPKIICRGRFSRYVYGKTDNLSTKPATIYATNNYHISYHLDGLFGCN